VSGIRADRVTAALAAVAILLSWIVTFHPSHDWGGDFSLYVSHARNIAQGTPYGDVHFLTPPEVPPQSPRTYPPVFPLLLAPVYAIFGLNYTPMKILVQVLWLFGGVLFYLLARRRDLPAAWAAGISVVFLLSSMVLQLKDSVVSEGAYVVISGVALLLLDSVYRKEHDQSRPLLFGALTGVLLALTYLTRVTGVGLIAGFAVYDLWRSRRVRPFTISAGVTVVAVIAIYKLTLADAGGSYANQFLFTPRTWAANLVFYLKSFGGLWQPLPATIRYPLSGLTLVLAAYGLVLSARKKFSTAEPYVLIYMIPLLLFSYGATVRYILPIYPLVLIFAAEALRSLILRLPEPGRVLVYGSVAAIVLAAAAVNVGVAARAPLPDGPESADFQKLVTWVRQNTAESDIIVAWNPRVLALYTNRPSSFYVFAERQVAFDTFVRRLNAGWIVTFPDNEADAKWLIPHVRLRPDKYPPAAAIGRFMLYRVAPEGAQAASVR